MSGVDDGGLRMRDRGPSKLSGPKFPELKFATKRNCGERSGEKMILTFDDETV